VCLGEFRATGDGAAPAVDRLVRTAVRFQRLAEIVVRLGKIRLQRQRRPKAVDRLSRRPSEKAIELTPRRPD
jgi:hypothetical protein